MIRPLRHRHRLIACTLGVLLPAGFAAGIAARRSVPVVSVVPSGLEPVAQDLERVVWSRTDLWPDQGIITRLRRNESGAVAVELMFRDWIQPDTLVYWSTASTTPGDDLPKDARLLGAMVNLQSLPLNPDLRGATGHLVLYSLADHEVVAVSQSFAIPVN